MSWSFPWALNSPCVPVKYPSYSARAPKLADRVALPSPACDASKVGAEVYPAPKLYIERVSIAPIAIDAIEITALLPFIPVLAQVVF